VGKYTEYKDNSTVWIKKLPSHWDVKKIFWLFKTIGSGTTPLAGSLEYYDGDFSWLCTGDLTDGLITECANTVTARAFKDYSALKMYPAGSLVIALYGATIGKLGITTFELCTNQACCVLGNSNDVTIDFAFYLLYAMRPHLLSVAYGGGQPNISQNLIKAQRVGVPPIDEQSVIVVYLNHRIAEIDNLLANLQNQVEMLERYKRELIANTITHGLDKNAPKKDSGVDWIGEVPTHWEVTKTKWIFEIVKRIYGKEDRDVLSITNRGLKIRDIESNEGQLAESYANYQVVNVNDFAMNSMDLLTGWVDCSPFEGVTSPDYRVFRFFPNKQQCHNYYKYLFQMCYKNRIFYRLGQGVSNLGRWRLQADQFMNMRLPQPPIHEQEEIATFLDKKNVQVDGLITDINEQIDKLKQYRQIVIHDAVTGKIKVSEGNGYGD
jgi:type I restriction enzyme S subunit